VLDKKRGGGGNLRKASSLSNIPEEPPHTALDLELEIVDRLREIREKYPTNPNLSKIPDDDDEYDRKVSSNDEIIYFLSRDRNGKTNLKMRFVNSLSNLSTIIRNGINKINDNGK
jgi:hypothetical protein